MSAEVTTIKTGRELREVCFTGNNRKVKKEKRKEKRKWGIGRKI
jgi:hypothetical protein